MSEGPAEKEEPQEGDRVGDRRSQRKEDSRKHQGGGPLVISETKQEGSGR